MIADESIAQVSLNATVVSFVVAAVIPVLVGIVTKARTSSGVKGLLTLVLNAANALIVNAAVADGKAVISKETFVNWLLALAISIATYKGLYKPAGVTSTPNQNGVALLNGTTPHQS